MAENELNEEKRKKLLMTIGLAAKAGKIICGTPLICEGLRQKGKGKPVIVLEGSDTSENTHKRLSDKCAFYETPLIKLPASMSEISAAVGKTSLVAALGIKDTGLADAILSKLD
ncbi:MAG: ribosomal L7Ae/L30e/S12e/Gadd45 family protein [Clostridia bacterium]|nr:ribosomal L7Ae/L30e/S12e/Gadd45 family protein [Clostridia bacterium]